MPGVRERRLNGIRRRRFRRAARPKREVVADGRSSNTRQLSRTVPTGRSDASLSSHTHKQFRTTGRFDSGHPWHQLVATKTDARNRFPKTASRNSLSTPDYGLSTIGGTKRSGGKLIGAPGLTIFKLPRATRAASYQGRRQIAGCWITCITIRDRNAKTHWFPPARHLAQIFR